MANVNISKQDVKLNLTALRIMRDQFADQKSKAIANKWSGGEVIETYNLRLEELGVLIEKFEIAEGIDHLNIHVA